MQLALLCPEDLSVAQLPVYEAFERAIQADGYQGFEVRNADGAFVGPWGVILQFPELAAPLGRFIDLVQNLDGVSERARQVIILTIGGRYPGRPGIATARDRSSYCVARSRRLRPRRGCRDLLVIKVRRVREHEAMRALRLEVLTARRALSRCKRR